MFKLEERHYKAISYIRRTLRVDINTSLLNVTQDDHLIGVLKNRRESIVENSPKSYRRAVDEIIRLLLSFNESLKSIGKEYDVTTNVTLNMFLDLVNRSKIQKRNLVDFAKLYPVVLTTKDGDTFISIPPLSSRDIEEVQSINIVQDDVLWDYVTSIVNKNIRINLDDKVIVIGSVEIPVDARFLLHVTKTLGRTDEHKKLLEELAQTTLKEITKPENIVKIKPVGVSTIVIELDPKVLDVENSIKAELENTPIEITVKISGGYPQKYEGELVYKNDLATIYERTSEPKSHLRDVIRTLLSNASSTVNETFKELRKTREILEQVKLRWSNTGYRNNENIYVKAVGEEKIGNTQIKVRFTGILEEGSEPIREAKGEITVTGPIAREIGEELKKSGEEVTLVEDGFTISIIGSIYSSSITALVLVDVLSKIREMVSRREGEITKRRQVKMPVSDHIVLYLTRRLVARDMNLYDVIGRPDPVIVSVISKNLPKLGVKGLDAKKIIDNPRELLDKLIEIGEIRIRETDGEIVVIDNTIENILSKYDKLKEKYSVNVLSQMVKSIILNNYKKVKGISLVKEVYLKTKDNIEVIKKLIREGSPVEKDVLLSKVNGKPVWNYLSPHEKSKVIEKLPVKSIIEILQDEAVDKNDMDDIIGKVCQKTTGDTCTKLIVSYNPKLVGLPKHVRTIEINGETYVDAGMYAIQVLRLGPINKYKVVSKLNQTTLEVDAQNPVQAIRVFNQTIPNKNKVKTDA